MWPMWRARSCISSAQEYTANVHGVAKVVAENASEQSENVDFFSENSIGAAVVCCWSLIIWLFFLPVFHLTAVPWMKSWEGMHALTVPEYMQHAEDTYATPHVCFQVLDSDGDRNSTFQEFQVGSETFKKPPFRYPAEIRPIFDTLDANKDGAIQAKEFYRATPAGVDSKWHINMTDLQTRARQAYENLDSYFTQAMDLNGDGKVTFEEWKNAAKLLTPPVEDRDAKVLFKEADKDASGVLEPREWVSFPVNGNFTFSAMLPQGVVFPGSTPGPKVLLAVQTGISTCLQILPTDVLTITGVQNANLNAPKAPVARKLVGINGTNVTMKIRFEILTGTRVRRRMLQLGASKMPSPCFATAFEFSLMEKGGTTTGQPGSTSYQKIVSGPLSDKELQEYDNVPCIIEGNTQLMFTRAKAAFSAIAIEHSKLTPIVQSAYTRFAGHKVRVEVSTAQEVQDTTGGGGSNKTMEFRFSSTLRNGGAFQRKVKEKGWMLLRSVSDDITKQNFPGLAHVAISSWTRFTAEYYGSQVVSCSRGPRIVQHFGMYQRIRNDTGTAPFVNQ